MRLAVAIDVSSQASALKNHGVDGEDVSGPDTRGCYSYSDECSAPIDKDRIYLLQDSLSQSLIDFFPVWQKRFSLEER